jgi:hypothetical protein
MRRLLHDMEQVTSKIQELKIHHPAHSMKVVGMKAEDSG